MAADGKTTSMITTEISTSFGLNAILGAYDVSDQGMKNIQREVVMALLKANPEDKVAANLRERYDSEYNTAKYANELDSWLLSNGMERIEHPGHSDGSEKRTYRVATPGVRNIEYGNIEICVSPNWDRNAAYVSYNYGNNTFSHILIDLFGDWGRGY